MDMQLIAAGLQVTVFGLGGVFAVLILFYAATKCMLLYTINANKKKAQKS